MSQPRLFEFRMGERSPETLVLAEANRDAARLLTGWAAWPNGALALVGPQGSGKTHLAMAWSLEVGARELAPTASPEAGAALFEETRGRLLVEDAAEGFQEATLWTVLDLVRSRGGAVLLTASRPPALWGARLPDLRSRLAALPLARLGEPDGALMEVVLRRICREQFIQLSDDAAKFLGAELPRTFAAARDWAAALDADLVKGSKPVTVAGAKRALKKARAEWGRRLRDDEDAQEKTESD